MRASLPFVPKPVRAPTKARTAGGVLSALLMPSNVNGNENNLPYSVLEFNRPDLDGLPMWGPSGQGVTIIQRVKYLQAPGYKASRWMTRSDGNFDGVCWGAHPYPVGGGNTTTTHQKEVGAGGNDHLTTRAGGSFSLTVGQWYVEGIRVNRVSSSQKFVSFYCNLPSLANADVIDSGDLFSIGEGTISSLKFIMGDSPWYANFQNERHGGYYAETKIIAKLMSEADMVTEAGDMSRLVTPDAQSWIWWGKRGFRTVDDLTCDFGTGRSLVRNDASNLITLGSIV